MLPTTDHLPPLQNLKVQRNKFVSVDVVDISYKGNGDQDGIVHISLHGTQYLEPLRKIKSYTPETPPRNWSLLEVKVK
jgi:hypothetical protein